LFNSLTLPQIATGKMIRNRNFIPCLTILTALLLTAPAAAQQDLITVTLQPDNTDWQWQNYAESISSLFANSISSRVNQGIESNEFEPTTAATVLSFGIRIDSNGELGHFTPISPQNRYHIYLIRRTAERVQPFRPTPRELPVFYFDGVVTFECRFQPTRWYKKLYFEQPIDSLELPLFTPMIKATRLSDPALPGYEPVVADKKQLLVEFKHRIGVTEEITDTSSYSPLDVAGRVFFVHVPYDSLGVEAMSDLLLQTRLERALEKAGARITDEDYDPQAALAAAERATAVADSIAGLDSTDVSIATEADSTDTPEEDETLRGIPPDRNLVEAFGSVFNSEFLVLSAALAQDSTGDSALCRVTVYPSEHPGQLKRNLSYKFSARSSLPDSLGIQLVQRLTAPPKKPAPPAKPAPKVSAAADTTAIADPTAAADTSAATTPRLPAATADSTTADRKASVADSTAPAAADTSAAAVQKEVPEVETPAKTAPADSLAPAEEPTPSGTDTTAAETP
jgi:hypothetical protein